MIQVATGDKSPHVVTGALISGMSEELVEKENKVVGMQTDPTEIARLRALHLPEILGQDYFLLRSMSVRQGGKKSNHGLNYGMEANRFSLETEMDIADARKVVTLYRTVAYPGLPEWYEGIKRQLREDRTLTNCFGDKRRFLDQWGPDLWMAAYAYIPQSTNVRMVNNAMRQVYNDEALDKFRGRAQVHDSINYQHPVPRKRNQWLDLAKGVWQIGGVYLCPLLTYSGRDFHVKTDLKIGWNWGANVEDENGKITRMGMRSVKLTPDIDKLATALQDAWETVDGKKKAA